MSAPVKTTTWYRAHYEKIILIFMLLALAGSALWLLLKISHAGRALDDSQWERVVVRNPDYIPRSTEEYTTFQEALLSPTAWLLSGIFLVSDMRVLSVNPDVPTPVPYKAEVCPWTQYPQPGIGDVDTLGDGIPDFWYVQHGLDPFDPELASRDVDGDGFTVREERDAGTDPTDPTDHPSYATKLRLRRVVERPFPLRFEGVSEMAPGDMRYNLNERTGDRMSHFARLGDVIDGYTVANFESRTVQGPHGQRVDASILTLEREGRQYRLVANRDFTGQERAAEMIFLVDRSIHRVNRGDSITLRDKTYNVIDIGSNHVLIRDLDLEENVRVAEKTEEERIPSGSPEEMHFEDMFDRHLFE